MIIVSYPDYCLFSVAYFAMVVITARRKRFIASKRREIKTKERNDETKGVSNDDCAAAQKRN